MKYYDSEEKNLIQAVEKNNLVFSKAGLADYKKAYKLNKRLKSSSVNQQKIFLLRPKQV